MANVTALKTGDIAAEMRHIAEDARDAARALAQSDGAARNAALLAAAAEIRARAARIETENARDMEFGGEKGLSAALMDRLLLTLDRIEAMAKGLEDVAALPDPLGIVLAEWDRPNGLHISRVRVPLGVIGIIYESRPNVTADAGGLCLKAGNAAILRGGSESFHSSTIIAECLQAGLTGAGLPAGAIRMPPTRDRAAVGAMLTMPDLIDVIVPRGGRSLIERVLEESRVPVLAHLEGVCSVYAHEAADPDMARQITLNAKMRRTGICGAAENLLVDRSVAAAQLTGIVDDLTAAGCEVRGDDAARAIDSRPRTTGRRNISNQSSR
jgi:glutamate-5-semialdehyde dehydrogenase